MRIHPVRKIDELEAPLPTARTALDTPHQQARSLYIHVPFCFHKCHYCDFYSIVDTQDRQAPFIDALCRELTTLAPYADASHGLNTIFIGGGTPSLLRPELWRRLLNLLNEQFNLDPIRAGRGEFTVECNPETVTSELMSALAEGGVDRVSVGAQSFSPEHLKTLERWHDPSSVRRAMSLAAQAGIRRRSADLIYAIPGQTMEEVGADLDLALALDPAVEHISAYCLTFEPNTALTRRAERGEITPLDDDLAADMQTLVYERLRDAGFIRYEVSNFASGLCHIPGDRSDRLDSLSRVRVHSPAIIHDARSQHNLAYWRGDSWLAAGPSASGHVRTIDLTTGLPAGVRWKNTPRLSRWMECVRAMGISEVVDLELPEPRRALVERIMMGLRLREGLNAPLLLDHAARLGCAGALRAAADRQIAIGLLEERDECWRLTNRGFLYADGVAGELMRSL